MVIYTSLCIDNAFDFSADDNQLVVKEYEEDNPNQQWKFEHGFLKNKLNDRMVLAVSENTYLYKKVWGEKLGLWPKNTKQNQQWKREPLTL